MHHPTSFYPHYLLGVMTTKVQVPENFPISKYFRKPFFKKTGLLDTKIFLQFMIFQLIVNFNKNYINFIIFYIGPKNVQAQHS